MIKEIQLPEISENVESGDVTKVLVAEGDQVNKEQPVLELETDKAGFEMPSPEQGKIVEIDVKEGDTVKVGQVLMKLETDGRAEGGGTAQGQAPGEEKEVSEKEQPARREEPAEKEEAAEEERPAAEKGVAEEREEKPAAEAPPQPAEEPPPASPSVRREAREMGIDIGQVRGTGSGERITHDDLKTHVREGRRAPAQAPAQAPLPDFSLWGEVEREAMTKVRKLTAERMQQSWRTVPHVSHFDEADVTDLEDFRRKYSNAKTADVKLTLTAIIAKVTAMALNAFPRFNASLDMEKNEIVYKKYINIGIAVDTERGLLVPVIRNAETKDLFTIAREIEDLAQRAREKKISPDEMQGGNFTVSNLGGIGGTGFAPVIYHPQVAILGVSRAREVCRFVDDLPVARRILPLSVSYDHRIIDGADGARFLRWIAQALENPFLIGLQGGR